MVVSVSACSRRRCWWCSPWWPQAVPRAEADRQDRQLRRFQGLSAVQRRRRRLHHGAGQGFRRHGRRRRRLPDAHRTPEQGDAGLGRHGRERRNLHRRPRPADAQRFAVLDAIHHPGRQGRHRLGGPGAGRRERRPGDVRRRAPSRCRRTSFRSRWPPAKPAPPRPRSRIPRASCRARRNTCAARCTPSLPTFERGNPSAHLPPSGGDPISIYKDGKATGSRKAVDHLGDDFRKRRRPNHPAKGSPRKGRAFRLSRGQRKSRGMPR